eukprot:s165_g2.t1
MVWGKDFRSPTVVSRRRYAYAWFSELCGQKWSAHKQRWWWEGRPSAASLISPRESRFEVNDWVWSPDANVGYRRSRVVSVDDGRDSLCVDHPEGGAVHVVRKSELRPFYDVGETRTFQDNTEMVHLDDANILDNLRKRYVKDEIYTYTANVLLAVNPYKSLSHLYSKEVMSKYWGKNPGTLPPHPYAISDVAYRQMLRDRKNQDGAGRKRYGVMRMGDAHNLWYGKCRI